MIGTAETYLIFGPLDPVLGVSLSLGAGAD